MCNKRKNVTWSFRQGQGQGSSVKENFTLNLVFWVGMGWGIGHLAQKILDRVPRKAAPGTDNSSD